MREIFYTGIHPETLTQILPFISQEVRLTEVSESSFNNFNESKDALLLGEEVDNPIEIAQKVYQKDKSLSILIIKDSENYQKFKQALIFTPFIGNTVQCISNQDISHLAHIISEVSKSTVNRRKFEKLKPGPVPFETTPNTDSLKRKYIDNFYEKSPVGALLIDPNGIVLAINPYVTRLINQTETDILGKSFFNYFSEEENVKEFVKNKFKEIKEGIFKRSSGVHQFLKITVTGIESPNFKDFKSILIWDVTEKIDSQRKIEEQLEELNTSNEELKKVNSDLDSFIYTASHDLKAPVSNIEGLIYTLRDSLITNYGGLKEEPEALIQMVEASIDRFKNTLLDMTEVIKTQRSDLADIKKIDAAEIIEDVKLILQNEIKKTDAEIIVNTSEGNEVSFSKKNFRSIMYNLISNAIKYRCPDRKIKILIEVQKNVDYCILTIKDNGLGISPENQARMFTMFKRFHSHVEGTGIGLYIVKRIIDNAGGKIDVESEVGKGTTFRLYFRRNKVSSEQE